MKQELPIAIGLLAVGCLLWISGGLGSWGLGNGSPGEGLEAKTLAERQLRIADLDADRNDQQEGDSTLAKPDNPLIAEKQRLNAARTDQTLNFPDAGFESISAQADGSSTTSNFLHAAPDPRAVEYLNRTSSGIANSIPFGMMLQLRCHLFEREVFATGKYFQMGQGSHRSRLELVFGDSSDSHTSFQLCDGRFVYRLQTIGGRQQFEFVDLNRISERTGSANAYSPSDWVATGGLASLLQQFKQSFNFGSPKQTRLENGAAATVLRGCWNETALKHILGNQVPDILRSDNKLRSRNQIHWDKVPPQLPHGVEVTFVNDPELGNIPMKIRYVQFVNDPATSAIQLEEQLSMEFSQPTQLQGSLSDNMFVIRSSDIDSVDTTDEYLNQVGTIMALRQADLQQKKHNQIQ